MHTRSSADPLYFDPEIERTARLTNSWTRKRKALERLASQEPLSPVSPDLSLTSIPEEEDFIMAEEGEVNQPRRTLNDYCANTGSRFFNTIARPEVQAHNVEMKASLIHLIQ